METRENLELRLKQIEGALASAVADNLKAEATIEIMLAALKEVRTIPLPPRITDLVYAAIAKAEGRYAD